MGARDTVVFSLVGMSGRWSRLSGGAAVALPLVCQWHAIDEPVALVDGGDGYVA